MLNREDFYMIKQMRQQGAYIVDIATQVGCSEWTVTGISFSGKWDIRVSVGIVVLLL